MKNSKVVLFCLLKKLVRPETFGPCYVSLKFAPRTECLLSQQRLKGGKKVCNFVDVFYAAFCLTAITKVQAEVTSECDM